MAQSHMERNWNDPDADVRESLRVIRRQRTAKTVGAIAAIVVAILAAFVFTYLAYSDEFESQKTPVTAPAP